MGIEIAILDPRYFATNQDTTQALQIPTSSAYSVDIQSSQFCPIHHVTLLSKCIVCARVERVNLKTKWVGLLMLLLSVRKQSSIWRRAG